MALNWLLPRLGIVSHILAALLPLAWHFGTAGDLPDVWLTLFCALFGLLPDIDTGASFIGRLFWFLSRPIESRFGHRTATHSILAVIIIGFITWLAYGDDWVWLTAAYGSHLIIDMIIGGGIPLFWPSPHLLYFVQVKSGTYAELLLVVVLAIGVAIPLYDPQSAETVTNIVPEQPTPRPTLTPTPMIFTIRIANVYSVDDEILVGVGDVIEQGQRLANLDTWRSINLEELAPTAVASATPTETAVSASPTPMPTFTPWPTPDPLHIAALQNNRDLARARYRSVVATTTPDPVRVAAVGTLQAEIQDRRDCDHFHQTHGTDESDWRWWACRTELWTKEAQATAVVAAAAPQSADVLNADIAYLQLQAAEIAYQQAIERLTPRATPIPTQTPTVTSTATPTLTAVSTSAAATATPTLPAADPFTVYSQLSGKVAAVNLVSVEGNSVTIQITVLVDGSDPLFANPFPAAIEPAEIATNDNIPAEAMRARVIRVADGDTLTVMIEDGQLAGFEETIRMLGIDTPETVHPKRPPECYGQQASDFTKATFAGSEAATAIVLVQLDPQTETRDRFGRLLAHLWLEDGRLFNEILLAEGYARHNDYGSASVHKARYTAAEINAQTNQLGLWSACQ